MRFILPSRLIGTMTAATIAITSLGITPAYADRDDRAARAVATVLGIAVLGAIIHDRNKDEKSHKPTVRRHPVQVHRKVQKPRAHRVAPKPLPKRVNRKLVPQNCLQSFRTRQGRTQMFGQRCLQRSHTNVNHLPQRCFQRIRTREGHLAGYDARCLSKHGYQLSRR